MHCLCCPGYARFSIKNMKAILGKKIGMSQIFEGEKVIPVTIIEAGPCSVTKIKTKEGKDKYDAVQIIFNKKAKEFKGISELKQGDEIKADIFKPGDKVKVSGISKGKGFQGAVKRWNFKGKPATHGTKHEMRTLGSVGCRFPQRVIKGRKMPGRMGSDRKTINNLEVVKVDLENSIIAIKGAVPGRKGTLLEIYAKNI